jgi:hypothetical protein
LEPQTAGAAKDGATIAGECLAESGAVAHGFVAAREQLAKPLPMLFESLRPHVLPDLHHAIGDQDRLCLALARAQAVKVGRVVRPQQDGLAVEHGAIDLEVGDRVADGREFE